MCVWQVCVPCFVCVCGDIASERDRCVVAGAAERVRSVVAAAAERKGCVAATADA